MTSTRAEKTTRGDSHTEQIEDGNSSFSFLYSKEQKSKQYFQTCGNEEESESEKTDRFSKVMLFLADTYEPEKDDSDSGANEGDQNGLEDARFIS